MANKYIIPQNSYALWKVADDDIVPIKDIGSIAVNTVWVADDDMPLEWYDNDGNKHTIDVKKNDIIIAFYNRHFEHKVIVANSKDWLDNITAYKEYQEKEKADWAKRNMNNSNPECVSDPCDPCGACTDTCGC